MGLRNCRMASSEELNAPILVETEDGSGQLTDFDVESQEAQPSWDFQTLCTYILLSLVGWGLGSLAVWMWAENYYIPYFLAVYVAGEIVCLGRTCKSVQESAAARRTMRILTLYTVASWPGGGGVHGTSGLELGQQQRLRGTGHRGAGTAEDSICMVHDGFHTRSAAMCKGPHFLRWTLLFVVLLISPVLAFQIDCD